MCGSTASYFIKKFGEDRAFSRTMRLVVGHSNISTNIYLNAF